MTSAGLLVDSVDPKATEEFLIAQEEVVDASVWFDSGELKAHVTLMEDAHWDRERLRELCMTHVGHVRTPKDFVLLRHRTRRG